MIFEIAPYLLRQGKQPDRAAMFHGVLRLPARFHPSRIKYYKTVVDEVSRGETSQDWTARAGSRVLTCGGLRGRSAARIEVYRPGPYRRTLPMRAGLRDSSTRG